jgi:hypothetical protein
MLLYSSLTIMTFDHEDMRRYWAQGYREAH